MSDEQKLKLLKTIDKFNIESLNPIFINMIILVIFIVVFILLTNIASRKKRKIG